MAEEKFDFSKELISYLDISADIDSAEKLKAAIDGKFISRIEAVKDPSIIGAINGGYETKMKNLAKEAGIEFEDGELKDKKLPDIFSAAIAKQKTAYSTEIEDLKKKAPASDAITKWEEKYKKQTDTLNDFKGLATTRATEIEKIKADQETFIKGQKIKAHTDSAFQSVDFSNTVDKFQVKGFKAEMSETYKPDFDEDGNIYPTKDGKRIPNENKKDTFLSYQELFNFEAVKADLTPKNLKVAGQRVQPSKPNLSGIVSKPEQVKRQAVKHYR